MDFKEEPITDSELWINIAIITGLSLFSGLMAGLTVGFMSIDDLVMELKAANGTDEEKGYAKKVIMMSIPMKT